MRAAGPWGHKECKKKFFIQNPQFELYIFSRIGLLALSLVVKQISKVEDCHCIVWRGSLSTVFDRFVISCEFLAAIFLPQSRKCYWKMIQINSWGAAFFFLKPASFVWLLKAPQLSGAMLLFDCFLSPELLLVKILAVALVGTFRELPIGSQELRLARAETLSNDDNGPEG